MYIFLYKQNKKKQLYIYIGLKQKIDKTNYLKVKIKNILRKRKTYIYTYINKNKK